MGINLFRLSNLISIAIKVFFYNLVQNSSSYLQYLRETPFFMTRFQDYERVNEAHYFIDQGKDPYTIEHVFQKPLEVYIYYWIRDIPYVKMILFILADIIISEIITSTYFLHSRAHMKQLKTEDKEAKYVLQQITKSKILRDQSLIRFIYLFNPLSIAAICIEWTSIFQFCFGFLSIYLLHNKSGSIILGGICYGISVYLNPVMLMLLPVIFIALNYKNRKTGQQITIFLILSIITLIGLVYYSYVLTGYSWKFAIEAYYKAYVVTIYQPTCGMIWALFSGMFNRYQHFYFCFFAIIPLTLIYPIYKILGKGIRKFEWDSEYNGLLGYACCVCLFIGYLYFSFITIFELSLFITLFYSAYQYAFKVQVLIVFNYTSGYMIGLTSCLTGLWLYGLTGNPNFCFFQTTVSYLFAIAAFTESIKEYSKSHPIEELQQMQEALIQDEKLQQQEKQQQQQNKNAQKEQKKQEQQQEKPKSRKEKKNQ